MKIAAIFEAFFRVKPDTSFKRVVHLGLFYANWSSYSLTVRGVMALMFQLTFDTLWKHYNSKSSEI